MGIKGALTEVASAALQASKEYHETLWGMGSRSSGCGGGERGVVGKGPLPRFQRWGPVGVLNVSSFSSQVDLALGQKHAGRGLLSSETWAWLEDFFRSPEICLQVRVWVFPVPGGAGCFHLEERGILAGGTQMENANCGRRRRPLHCVSQRVSIAHISILC